MNRAEMVALVERLRKQQFRGQGDLPDCPAIVDRFIDAVVAAGLELQELAYGPAGRTAIGAGVASEPGNSRYAVLLSIKFDGDVWATLAVSQRRMHAGGREGFRPRGSGYQWQAGNGTWRNVSTATMDDAFREALEIVKQHMTAS